MSKFNFEQVVIFGFLRFLAYFFICIAVLGVVFGGFFVFLKFLPKSTFVSYDEIVPQKEKKGAKSYLNQTSEEEIPKLPKNLEKYLSEQDYQVIKNWLSGLTMKQKKDFLNNLQVIIKKAEKKGDNVIDIINRYHKLKIEKISENIELKGTRLTLSLTYAGYVIAAIGLIALFTLVLLLLAIERNTRHIPEAK